MTTIAENKLCYTKEEELNILRKAISQVNVNVFLYDLPLQVIHFLNGEDNSLGILETEYTLEDIIEKNKIELESIPALKMLFDKIQKGERQASTIIKVRNDKKAVWYQIVLNNSNNCTSKPHYVVGTIQDVSKRVESELRYSNEQQYRFAMFSEAYRVYEINVTKDRFKKLETIQDNTDGNDWNLYTETMANLCKNNVYREDWNIFLKVATRENLLAGFKNGITEFHCEYRLVKEKGEITWSESSTHLLGDPISGDIKGFIYVKDINERKKREIELYHQAETDPLTGVYNRRTAERIITEELLNSDASTIHGFLSIDIDDFKKVNDTFGHVKGDWLLQRITEVITGTLREKDILARMGGDEFIVFLNDSGNQKDILRIANRLCEHVRNITIAKEQIFHTAISIGISTYPKDGKTFAELYKNSDKALYDVKQHGKNNAGVFSGE